MTKQEVAIIMAPGSSKENPPFVDLVQSTLDTESTGSLSTVPPLLLLLVRQLRLLLVLVLVLLLLLLLLMVLLLLLLLLLSLVLLLLLLLLLLLSLLLLLPPSLLTPSVVALHCLASPLWLCSVTTAGTGSGAATSATTLTRIRRTSPAHTFTVSILCSARKEGISHILCTSAPRPSLLCWRESPRRSHPSCTNLRSVGVNPASEGGEGAK